MTKDCTYKTPDGEVTCERPSFKDNKCLFHLSTTQKEKLKAGEFYSKLCDLAKEDDTNWAGFIFPENFKLYDLTFNTVVDLRWSVFENVVINKITCNEKFDMRHSIVNGDFHISEAVFNKDADFFGSIFLKHAYFNTRHLGRAGFHGYDFYGRTSFLGSISGTGTFYATTFHEAVTFRGGRDITIKADFIASNATVFGFATVTNDEKLTFISKAKMLSRKIKNSVKTTLKNLYHRSTNAIPLSYKTTKHWLNKQRRRFTVVNDGSVTFRWLFDSEIIMTEVEFRRPEGTKFMGVDMSKVSLIGTDVKGVHFDDVKFYQPALKRQGLYDEILLLYNLDYSARSYLLPRVESEYRNVRVAMENNKNFSAATDFYVGEMETRRHKMFYPKRYVFSIEAIYHALSNFGASPFRAIRMFLWLVLLHAVLTITYAIGAEEAYLQVFGEKVIIPLINDTFNTSIIYIINSFKILTLQRGEAIFYMGSLSGHIIDAVFRVLGPIQVALIILAIRVKIKRY